MRLFTVLFAYFLRLFAGYVKLFVNYLQLISDYLLNIRNYLQIICRLFARMFEMISIRSFDFICQIIRNNLIVICWLFEIIRQIF